MADFDFEEFVSSPNTILLKKEVVLGILLFYVFLSKPLFGVIRDTFSVSKDGKLFRLFMLLHNAALCVFSGWVCYNVTPLFINYVSTEGWTAHSEDAAFWSKFEYWAIVFYVSKYYEFFDSWILVLKGANPSFLQV